MALTPESVLAALVAAGGRVRKAELVGQFAGAMDSDDPAEKRRNRELFKTIVNDVAFVKVADGVRYVVIKRMYHHLLESVLTAGSRVENAGTEETQRTGEEEQRGPPALRDVDQQDPGEERPAVSECDQESTENPSELISPIELALQRSRYTSVRVKRSLSFGLQKQEAEEANQPTRSTKGKPYALPLRVPPAATTPEIRKPRGDEDEPPASPKLDALRRARRPETRSVKSSKVSEEPRETPSAVPLEHSEHEWLVKCAAGQWSQAYGLLLRDSQLAEKRDFISGFTALHWAAKSGNSDMLVRLIELSRGGGVDLDINAKTHGGYTALHIAALHDQHYILALLAGEYGADASVRDNRGKRAYHYLSEAASETVREMLGEPRPRQPGSRAPQEREEPDLFPDLSKGLHSISRLFQPHVTGHKKKHKQRPGFDSLTDDAVEESEDGGGGGGGGGAFRYRVGSDVSM